MKPYNLFLDLDGPILNVEERYFLTHCKALEDLGLSSIYSSKEYWNLKRNKVPERKIVENIIVDSEYEKYQINRIGYIETKEYLKYDKLQPSIRELLALLQQRYNIFLVTLRHNRINLMFQLSELNVDKYFIKILSDHKNVTDKYTVKVNLIRNENINVQLQDYFIGDTETDILAGKSLGIKTIALSCGIRNNNFLQEYAPDFLFESINDLVSKYEIVFI